MTLWSVIFVSFPEAIIFVVTIMIISGYKDLGAFCTRKNLAKIIFSAILAVASLDIGRYFINSIYTYYGLEVISISLIIYTTFKFRIRNTLIGVINAFIITTICDVIILVISYLIFDITYERLQSSDIIRFLLFIPKSILHFITIILLIKFKRLDLITIRNQLKYLLYISILFFISLGAVFIGSSVFKNLVIAKYEGFSYLVIIIFGFYAIAVLLVFTYLTEEKKKRLMADKKRDGELERMKQLINEGKIDQVLDLIDYSKK